MYWLEVVDVVGAGGGTGGVLEEAEVDGAALVGAVRPEVVHDLRAVFVGDLVLRAVKVRLEVKPVFHAHVCSVCVVNAVGAAGVVVVAVVAVGLLEEVTSHGGIHRDAIALQHREVFLRMLGKHGKGKHQGHGDDLHTIVAPMGVKTQVGGMAAGVLGCGI